MDDLVEIGRGLPLYALAPALGLTFLALVLVSLRVRSAAAAFVLWALYLRVAMGALHEFTFKASPAGISWNALASIAICGIGLFVIRRRTIFDAALLPFVPLLTVMIASGLYNGQVGPLTTAITKYAYLIVLILATFDALRDLGAERLFRLLLWPFLLPVGMQLLSIVLNVAKPGETNGADSYIGGYNHEAAFSVVLMAAVLVVCFARDLRLSVRIGFAGYGLVALLLANYRTAILAILPLAAVSIVAAIPARFVRAQRPILMIGMVLAVLGIGAAGALRESDRFSDLGAVAERGSTLIQRPELFSTPERQALSGRTMIWSQYIYAWVDARPMRKLIGFGPESWSQVFTLYAHNTLVSALWEVGVLGVLSMLLLWGWMLAFAFRVRDGPRVELVAAHLSFFILNMSTMPMWQIEGMIFYGLLCGYTVYSFGRSRVRAPVMPHASQQRWRRSFH